MINLNLNLSLRLLQRLQRAPLRVFPFNAPIGAAAQHHGRRRAGRAEAVVLREPVEPGFQRQRRARLSARAKDRLTEALEGTSV